MTTAAQPARSPASWRRWCAVFALALATPATLQVVSDLAALVAHAADDCADDCEGGDCCPGPCQACHCCTQAKAVTLAAPTAPLPVLAGLRSGVGPLALEASGHARPPFRPPVG